VFPVEFRAATVLPPAAAMRGRGAHPQQNPGKPGHAHQATTMAAVQTFSQLARRRMQRQAGPQGRRQGRALSSIGQQGSGAPPPLAAHDKQAAPVFAAVSVHLQRLVPTNGCMFKPANDLGRNGFNEMSFDMNYVWMDSNGLY